VATLMGPLQFLPRSTTRRYLRLHRWLGRVYLGGVLVGGLGGLYLAFLAYGGLPARLGFGLLAVAWLCWVPNLIAAELIVCRIRPGRLRAAQA
jgi:hypothetical protein